MDFGIANKKALVTGADSGIGFETARLLIEEGVQVAITDIDQDSVNESAKKLGGVPAFAADLTDAAAVAKLKEQVTSAIGSPDILVNTAGITGATGSFEDIDDDGWLKTLNTDLLSAVRVTRAFIPDMAKAGWGRVVFIGSEDAEQPYVDELPYCASKAGILSLSKGLSKVYASKGVLVNAVSPAFIATPMTDAMMKERAETIDVSFEEAITSFLDEERPFMELKRRGQPEEVAAVIAFLCSERASFVNGSNYRVDSGSVATI